MTRTLFSASLLLVSAALAVGCAPERDDIAPDAIGESRMAVLASDDAGTWDIQIMDLSGNALDSIDANLIEPVGLSRRNDGTFLVSDGSSIQLVEPSGEVSIFNQEPMPSVVYRMTITDDDEVTVAEEYDVTKLDENGELLSHTTVPGDFCWMDAAPGVDVNGDTALLDIFGPTIATWDSESGTFETVATGVGSGTSILGKDEGGNFYAASNWDDGVWMASPSGEVQSLGRLGSLGMNVWAVAALEPVSHDAVYALYDGAEGSGIIELDSRGQMEEVLNSDTAIWRDLVVF